MDYGISDFGVLLITGFIGITAMAFRIAGSYQED